MVWNVDFFVRLLTGKSLIGLSAYMFDPKIPVFIRGLSGFHIVLPLLLLWALHRLGYDHRAFVWQTIVALVVLPLPYLLSNPQENVNWVYGFGQNPQTILPAPLFVVLLMVLFPLAVYLPTHLLFLRIFRAAGS
jgi:predicted membrane protein